MSGIIGNNDNDGKVDSNSSNNNKKSSSRKISHKKGYPSDSSDDPSELSKKSKGNARRIHQMTYRHPALILLATTIKVPIRIIVLHPPIRNTRRRNVNTIDELKDPNG